jgi:hypothetical protein
MNFSKAAWAIVRKWKQKAKCAAGKHGRGKRIPITERGIEAPGFHHFECPTCHVRWTRRVYQRKVTP